MLIIKESDIKELVTLEEVINVNENVFLKQSKDQVVCPDRIVIPTYEKSTSNEQNNKVLLGNTYFKPSLIVDESIGIKIVAAFNGNAKKGLPATPATIVLNDIETGITNAIIGATYLTGLRTAAGSAIAIKYLTSDDNGSIKTLLVYGSGLQAQLHIRMILLVRPSIETVYIHSRTKANITKMVEELKNEFKNIKFEYNDLDESKINQEILNTVDIIATTTSSNEPLFDGKYLLKRESNKPLTIVAVGSSRPNNRELDSTTIINSNLIVDDVNSTMVSGELAITIKEGSITQSHIKATLSDVVSQKYKNQSLNDSSKFITVYKSSGTAIQDIATANLIYQKALKLKKGIEINMDE